MADQVPGFTLLRNKYQHYAWSTDQNEYLPQETEESQIQAWLSKNNHTWQTGFPSQSECAGQKGKLIPEMHDPLLNDPDVLR